MLLRLLGLVLGDHEVAFTCSSLAFVTLLHGSSSVSSFSLLPLSLPTGHPDALASVYLMTVFCFSMSIGGPMAATPCPSGNLNHPQSLERLIRMGDEAALPPTGRDGVGRDGRRLKEARGGL